MSSKRLSLATVERLSSRCIRILGANPGKFTLEGTNTYLLGTGRRRILIDTGEGHPAWAASLKATLEKEDATIETVLMSHWHHDHVGGWEDLLHIAPKAAIFKHMPDPGQLIIQDGQQFLVEGATLTAVHTPGHTVDHMVFIMAEEDAMFTADNVLGHGTAVFEDLHMYLESLNKMRVLFGGRAYPGHGPVVEDGPAKIVEYICHRHLREEQVLQTMQTKRHSAAGLVDDNLWTAMAIVKVVYSHVSEDLHAAACGGVLQILRKLQREGRVVRHEKDEWCLKDRPTI